LVKQNNNFSSRFQEVFMTPRPRIAHRLSSSILILLFMAMGSSIQAQTVNRKGVDPGVFNTPVTTADLDQANDVQWCNGKTQPADTADGKFNIIWTTTTATHHRGLSFGDSRDLGVRHVRLSLKRPVPIGSVLVNGNARLSVLKATVQGAGVLADESQWIAAQRMDGREITTEQPGGQSITLWVLPPNTKTRALRFSYEPKPTDSKFQGVVSGLYIISDRYANVALQAHVTASENPKDASRLIDGQNNSWGTWDNGDKGQSSVISPQNPVWLQLDFPSPVSLRGLEAYACGSKTVAMDVLPESFEGPLGGASEADWKRIKTADNLWDFYPSQLRPSFLDMGKDIKVRAVRMVMLAPHNPSGMHPHMVRRPADGKRVWLDELQALMPLGDKPLELAVLQGWEKHDAHPPIAVKFHLDQPGNVTLVIDDSQGKRVRNLIAQTPYPAGDNTAWWDGLDDLGRDVDAAAHGLYHVPGSLVMPGKYAVRGLTAPPVELTYEVSVDNAGTPPWPTPDNRGGWGTNHTPPSCIAVIPADRSDLNKELIFVGSYIAEGGHGIFWVDMEGNKQGGKHWLGGHWTGAQTVTGDVGPTPDPNSAVYVVSGFSGEVRFVALNRSLDEVILNKYKFVEIKKNEKNVDASVGDIAAHNGLIVASLPNIDALWLFDAVNKKLLGKIDIAEPFAVAFKPDGTLLATSGDKLMQINLDRGTLSSMPAVTDATTMPQIAGVQTKTLPMPLDHPRGMTVLANGNIAITQQGTHHQLCIYSPVGTLVQSIGNPGQPTIGTYDPNHMNKPQGVGVDSKGRFWIAEANTQPKRVSLWSTQGKLAKAWYGPSRYGGGGTLDPYDRSLFYNAGMQFKIDWKTGDSAVQRILMLAHNNHGDADEARPQFPSNQHAADGMPEQAHRVAGRKFFSNWHNGSPTNGTMTVTIWEDNGKQLVPVAAMGNAYGWWVTESEPFKSLWPQGTPSKNQHQHPVYFTWQDTNHNGICEPSETTLKPGKKSGITIMPDLTFVTAIDDKIVAFKPTVTGSDLRYDFENPTVLLEGAQRNVSSGGSTYMLMPDNRVIAYPPTLPYSNYGLGGGIAGMQADWSYPNMWPGLHPSHNSATPKFPGMVIGPTRLIGEPVTPRNSDIGPLWFLNANMGNIYVFTSDGLFVTELFHDSRTTTHWRMPVATRGMRVDHLTLGDETFWPTVTQVVDDGDIYICTGPGSASTLVQVHNLDKAKRLPTQSLTVDQDMLKDCLNWQIQSETARLANQVPSRITIPLAGKSVTVDGKLDEWQAAQWATIDQRGNKAYFNSNAMPYDVSAAMQVVGDRLYIAWRTTEKDLLQNSGEIDIAPFKTGGALDLMIATDPNAKPDRKAPVAGDQRLVITRVGTDRRKLKTWAVLYKAVVPGTSADRRVPFSSPVRTLTFDAVTDVTTDVQFAQNEGNFEVSIPLSVLGLEPKPGMAVKGDLGVLRGTLGKTTQRVYWSNKATAITADVPSEAELLPKLWGTFVFE
jgi:hypothetical protein